jgi:hypothetical protein
MSLPVSTVFIARIFALCALTGKLNASTATFDDLPNLPPVDSFAYLLNANTLNNNYAGVQWDANVFVVGKDYVEEFAPAGAEPYAKPHSGSFAIGNSNGADNIVLHSTKVLSGAWFARVDLGNGPYGATSVTVTAYAGSTPLGSASLALTSTTPAFLDTSSFTSFSGITGYRITRTAQLNGVGARLGSWTADDFQFSDPACADPTSLYISASSSAGYTLTWDSVVGGRYRIESSQDLTAPSWTSVGSDHLASNPFTSEIVPIPAADKRRFWRVRRLP